MQLEKKQILENTSQSSLSNDNNLWFLIILIFIFFYILKNYIIKPYLYNAK